MTGAQISKLSPELHEISLHMLFDAENFALRPDAMRELFLKIAMAVENKSPLKIIFFDPETPAKRAEWLKTLSDVYEKVSEGNVTLLGASIYTLLTNIREYLLVIVAEEIKSTEKRRAYEELIANMEYFNPLATVTPEAKASYVAFQRVITAADFRSATMASLEALENLPPERQQAYRPLKRTYLLGMRELRRRMSKYGEFEANFEKVLLVFLANYFYIQPLTANSVDRDIFALLAKIFIKMRNPHNFLPREFNAWLNALSQREPGDEEMASLDSALVFYDVMTKFLAIVDEYDITAEDGPFRDAAIISVFNSFDCNSLSFIGQIRLMHEVMGKFIAPVAAAENGPVFVNRTKYTEGDSINLASPLIDTDRSVFLSPMYASQSFADTTLSDKDRWSDYIEALNSVLAYQNETVLSEEERDLSRLERHCADTISALQGEDERYSNNPYFGAFYRYVVQYHPLEIESLRQLIDRIAKAEQKNFVFQPQPQTSAVDAEDVPLRVLSAKDILDSMEYFLLRSSAWKAYSDKLLQEAASERKKDGIEKDIRSISSFFRLHDNPPHFEPHLIQHALQFFNKYSGVDCIYNQMLRSLITFLKKDSSARFDPVHFDCSQSRLHPDIYLGNFFSRMIAYFRREADKALRVVVCCDAKYLAKKPAISLLPQMDFSLVPFNSASVTASLQEFHHQSRIDSRTKQIFEAIWQRRDRLLMGVLTLNILVISLAAWVQFGPENETATQASNDLPVGGIAAVTLPPTFIALTAGHIAHGNAKNIWEACCRGCKSAVHAMGKLCGMASVDDPKDMGHHIGVLENPLDDQVLAKQLHELVERISAAESRAPSAT